MEKIIKHVFTTFLLSVLTLSSAHLALARTVVPIKQLKLSDGTIRYYVSVKIGQKLVNAELDTGATGIRVLPGTLDMSDYKDTNQKMSISYGSGAQFSGHIGYADVSLQGQHTDAPIPIQIIDTVGCSPEKPHCPVKKLPASDYLIAGNGLSGEGFAATFGINMAQSPSANALAHMDNHTWLIVLPLPGTSEGRIIIGPTAAELRGFYAYHLKASNESDTSGFHDSLRACIFPSKPTFKAVCGPLLMDSGAFGVDVHMPDSTQVGWEKGFHSIQFYNNAGVRTQSFGFLPRDGQASDIRVKSNETVQKITPGMLPFFFFQAFYNYDTQTIALRYR